MASQPPTETDIGVSDMTTNTLHRQERTGPPKLLVSAREAAAALSISERSLWGLTNQGLLRCVRIGRSKRYAVDDLHEFINSK